MRGAHGTSEVHPAWLVAALAVAGATALVLAMLSFPDPAQAASRTFRPIAHQGRSLIFAPRRVDPGRVAKAKVTFRHRGKGRVHRRVAVVRVRSVLGRRTRLRVKRPAHAKKGRLKVKIQSLRAPAPPPSPTADNCVFGNFSSTNQPGGCWRPFSDTSPFNRGVSSSPPVVAASASIVSRTVSFGNGMRWAGGVADTADDWSHPIYYSQPSDPLYTVHCVRYSCPKIEGRQIRIPAQARAAGGGDGHLAVIDQAAQIEYDLFEVEDKPAGGGTIRVGSGGSTAIGTADADGLDAHATASGFALAAGMIRPAELESGQINHALFMVVKCTNGTAVWPSGNNPGSICSDKTNAPAMGQHFYLAMSDAEIAALGVPAWQKTVLRAIARYGMFVGDTGGPGFTVMAESGSSQTSFGAQDPWVALGQQYGLPNKLFDLRTAVDWQSKLRVADPCMASGAC